MRIKIIILSCCLFFSACTKLTVDSSVPAAVKSKIKSFSKGGCEDASASEYRFLQNTVYVLSPGTCGADMQSTVLTYDAEVLGYLGGISGNTTIQQVSFDSAVFIKTVWTK